MALFQENLMGILKEEIKTYLGTRVGDIYGIRIHRVTIYAVAFILVGLGVITALSVYFILMDIGVIMPMPGFFSQTNPVGASLKFMGINAWHTAANFVLCLILVDALAALIIRPWGTYNKRTIGKTWVVLFVGYLVGILSEQTIAYRLIEIYEPFLIYLWEVAPDKRVGTVKMFLYLLPIWIMITATLVKIITVKQAQTEELLRVRLETILEVRQEIEDSGPKEDAQSQTAAMAHTASEKPVQLPTDQRVGVIYPSDIGHVTAEDHYLRIYFRNGEDNQSMLVRMTFKELTDRLPDDRFVQIHRSHLVSLDNIARLRRKGKAMRLLLKHGDFDLPVSRYRLPRLLPMLEKYLQP